MLTASHTPAIIGCLCSRETERVVGSSTRSIARARNSTSPSGHTSSCRNTCTYSCIRARPITKCVGFSHSSSSRSQRRLGGGWKTINRRHGWSGSPWCTHRGGCLDSGNRVAVSITTSSGKRRCPPSSSTSMRTRFDVVLWIDRRVGSGRVHGSGMADLTLSCGWTIRSDCGRTAREQWHTACAATKSTVFSRSFDYRISGGF